MKIIVTQVFKRNEIKLLLTLQQYQWLFQELRRRMSFDPYCRNGNSYMVYSIYYDTDDDAVIRRSLEKPYYKEKLRLRSYVALCAAETAVFLELKKKVGGIVTKRRAVLSYGAAVDLVAIGVTPASNIYQNRQVTGEIVNFLSRYPVRPKVYISYERLAFVDHMDPRLRISFDHNILTRRHSVDFCSGNFGSPLLSDSYYLMEIKCADAIPLWLAQFLSKLQIYPTSFSKYGNEYRRHVQPLTKATA